jgi:precorrin-2 dehydrogenase/sirohydrochlorin ferrochelatase
LDEPNVRRHTVNASYPYPVFLQIEGKPCLVVGGGRIAYRKTLDLLECGATVTVVAETPAPEMTDLAAQGKIRLLRRRAEPGDVHGMFLVFAATDDDGVNASFAEHARAEGILVNAVDNPSTGNFTSGAVVKRGPLRIAVSTSGCSPLIASGIRRELEERYGESFGAYVAFAGELRAGILSEPCPKERKDEALGWIAGGAAFDLFLISGREGVWNRVREILFSL